VKLEPDEDAGNAEKARDVPLRAFRHINDTAMQSGKRTTKKQRFARVQAKRVAELHQNSIGENHKLGAMKMMINEK
jgi:hypothetical protein